MQVVYHPRYTESYASDPAASPGRIEAIFKSLEGEYNFVEPQAASEDDLELAHTRYHIENQKR